MTNKMRLIQTAREYANNGQHAEQSARFTLTGCVERADNIPASERGDVVVNGVHVQIKSARCTACTGTLNIREAVKADRAELYAVVIFKTETIYFLSKEKWIECVKTFGWVSEESTKNGKKCKIRMCKETKNFIAFLEENCGR